MIDERTQRGKKALLQNGRKTAVADEVICRAGPSLALIKYWGKALSGDNLPATPSLAVTLGGVYTETRVSLADHDSIEVDGRRQDPARFGSFFDSLRRSLKVETSYLARSVNSFPTSSGLASSSSGFAALAGACARASGRDCSLADLSALARAGSASAARAVFAGFVHLPAGAPRARQLFGPDHWPELRVVMAITTQSRKAISSREAMEATRATSSYYVPWLKESAVLLPEALRGVEERDLERLGTAARRSYSLMHAALLAASPPILYWIPATVALIRMCDRLRRNGVGAWETIDAGPQVKILCLQQHAAAVIDSIHEIDPGIETILCRPGPGLQWGEPEE